jgi:hypothetical protein
VDAVADAVAAVEERAGLDHGSDNPRKEAVRGLSGRRNDI